MRHLATIALILAALPAGAEDEIPPGVSCDPIGDVSSLLPEGVSLPSVSTRVEPVYPVERREDRQEGKVVLNAVVCSDGVPRRFEVVTEKPEGFRDAALEAVRRWRYEPARKNGEPVAVKLAIQVRFRLPDDSAGTGGMDVTLPVIRTRVEPTYPEEHRRAGEAGKVLLQARIERDGTVGAMTTLQATSYAFEVAAREAVRQWVYEPARRGGEPVAVDFTISVAFKPRGTPPKSDLGKVTPPPLLHDVPPVYPAALLAERRAGSVTVEVFVDRLGRIEKVEILHATDPAFAQAVREAIAQWRFGPGRLDGEATATSLRLTIPFRPSDPVAERGERP